MTFKRNFIRDIEQGTDEWLLLRLNKVTSSNMSKVIANDSKEKLTRTKYMRTLAAEAITGIIEESYKNDKMERGNLEEPLAVEAYEAKHGVETFKVAFIDCGRWGASPDRLIGDNGVLEAKRRDGHIQIESLERNEIPAANLWQCDTILYAADREWLDYTSYSPGLPLFTKRRMRDPKRDLLIQSEIDRFVSELDALIDRIRKYA